MEAFENETITIIDAPVKDGYSFICWKGSEYQPGDQYVVEADHTFIAQWEKERSSAVVPANKIIPKKTVVDTRDTTDLAFWSRMFIGSLLVLLYTAALRIRYHRS